MPKSKAQKPATIQPLGDRILINAPPREKPGAETVVGGIVIPAMSSGATRNQIDSPHFVTEVISVGEACKIVKAGQRIVVRKPDCFVCAIEGSEHVMVREGNVVAVVS